MKFYLVAKQIYYSECR